MAVPTVFRWDHKNAPVINDIQDWSQIQNWFQKIFVDGYLADDDTTMIPGLGWDVTIDDAGTPKYIYLDADSGSDSINANRMRIRLNFQYMLTMDRFGPHIYVWDNIDENYQITYSNASNLYGINGIFGFNNYENGTHVCPWIVIGSRRGVYFLSGFNHDTPTNAIPKRFSSSQDYSNWDYFGDYINDGWNMEKSVQTASDINLNGGQNVATWTNFKSNNSRKAFGPTIGFLINRLMNFQYTVGTEYLGFRESFFSARNYMGTWKYYMKYPYLDGGLYIKPFELWSYDQGIYLGRIPGLFYPQQQKPFANTFSLIEFDGTDIYEGQHFIGLGRPTYDEVYINTTADWGID